MEEDALHEPDEHTEEDEPELDEDGHPKKKAKDLIDDDTVSLEDEVDDELDEDEEEDDLSDGDYTYE